MSADREGPVFAVLNPRGGGCRRVLTHLRRQAAAAGRPLHVRYTTVEDPGPGQVEASLVEGATSIIVGGGDGTVRLVAGALAGTGITLGIVPCGTANLFARNLGLQPRRVRRNVEVAFAGAARRVDVGWSRARRGDVWSDEAPFLVAAGLGNDAAAVLATHHGSKARVGWLAYLVAGARQLGRPTLDMEVSFDGGTFRTVNTWCVLAGNCGRLPLGIRVFPDARPDDGVFDTLLMPLRRPTQWLGIAAKGVLRLRRDVAALEYGRARTVTVRPGSPQPLQLDGDVVVDVVEVAWRVATGALWVRTPRLGHSRAQNCA